MINSSPMFQGAEMTFSILAYDQKTGAYGGAAATGSLCVGGWVLRGNPDAGMSASQGTSPSTLWGDAVLDLMRSGVPAHKAVQDVATPDTGRDHRQLTAVDPAGGVAGFTGDRSVPVAHSLSESHVIVAGNMLGNASVLQAILRGYHTSGGPFAERLMAGLNAGQNAGGDSRGLQSAALLIVNRDAAPLTLRIDWSDDPLTQLGRLYCAANSEPYRSWRDQVPTLNAPHADGAQPPRPGPQVIASRIV